MACYHAWVYWTLGMLPPSQAVFRALAFSRSERGFVRPPQRQYPGKKRRGVPKPLGRPFSQQVQVSQLSSFTRTIPSEKGDDYVNQILSQKRYFIPLAYRPTKAQAGDFIYLVFRGVIVGRARIASIKSVASEIPGETRRYPIWAKWIVRYVGEWEKPPEKCLSRVIRAFGTWKRTRLIILTLKFGRLA